CLSIAFPCLQVHASSDDGAAKLYSLVHWDGMQSTNKGVAKLPTSPEDWTGRLDYLWKIKTYPYNYGGCHFEDKYYCNFLRILDGYILEQKAYIYDAKSGEEVDVIQMPTAFDLYDGAYYDPEGVIYGFVKDMTNGVYGWARVYPLTARMEIIKPYSDTIFYGVSVNEKGEAYAISGEGEVYKVDRSTGEATFLFKHDDLKTKTVPKAHTGATWDEENGRIVFAVCNLEKDGGSRLFSVDPVKKQVELMYKLDGMGTQLAGLYFEQNVKPGAPGLPVDLAVDFQPGSLSGKLTFTLPQVTYNGENLTGDVDYIVKVDGEQIAEGKGNCGSRQETEVEIDKAGWHTFHVRCSNAEGKGYAAKLDAFVGYESPLEPSDVSARHYGGKMHLSWTPSPETGAKGGPVNIDEIRYVIHSNQGEEFVTEPGETKYEYALPIPEKFTPYHYTVTARNADGESQPVSSNNVPVGVVEGDYIQDFSVAADEYDFTILDSNKDGKTWGWTEEGFMVIRYNEEKAMDDYLTLPPVNMDYGDCIELGFDAGVFNFDEEFEVKLGEDYNQQGMDNASVIYGPTVVPAEKNLEIDWHHQDVLVKAPDDGKFFISIHGISPADRNVLFIDNVTLRRLASNKVPARIAELSAIPDLKGKAEVEISGILPSEDVSGNAIERVKYVKIFRNGRLIATVETGTDKNFEWTDTDALKGENNYVVIAGNEDGDGLSARCSAFAGFIQPSMPDECEINYRGNGYDGVEFSWTPVDTDLNGLNVSDVVRYDVIRSLDGELSYMSQGQKETRYSDDFKNLKEPKYVQYGMYAVVDGVHGDMLVSPQIPVGPACQLPLVEGFYPEIKMAYGLENDLKSEDSGLFTTNDTEKYQSADGDGGYGVFIGSKSGESATLYSAWIHIPEDAEEPVVSLQYYGEGDAIANLIHIGVNTDINDRFRNQETIETGGMGWQTATVKLDRYRGQDIRVGLKFETLRNKYLRFDDLRVCDLASGSVDEIADKSFTVKTGKGLLRISGAGDESVSVCNTDGMKIYCGVGDITLNLKSGVYVVRAGDEIVKVIVK
ncbi:MAG: fibronectin type III domain-containing protein, partial [Muribaculaceae bacterium]|nr:fibronectin type III domain-containing protein [Muribaculaceae bacterium]